MGTLAVLFPTLASVGFMNSMAQGWLGLVLWALLLGSTDAAAAPPVATAVWMQEPERVVDGDTVVYPGGACRLIGIDAPETAKKKQPGQPLGLEAKNALYELLDGAGPNTIIVYGRDRYGRALCLILSARGVIVNVALVQAGWAEAYLLHRAPFRPAFEAAEAEAKAAKRGIWAEEPYESPSAFRARRKRPHPD